MNLTYKESPWVIIINYNGLRWEFHTFRKTKKQANDLIRHLRMGEKMQRFWRGEKYKKLAKYRVVKAIIPLS